jgi:hypothetical protein
MQLMPGTAKRFGVVDVCDPATNIDGGVRYLRLLLDRFKNPIIAAAAYNAGEQAVYDYKGVPPYRETVRYVAAVINRQLGLSAPVERRSLGVTNRTLAQVSSEQIGIIGARVPTFVGGVMQFWNWSE